MNREERAVKNKKKRKRKKILKRTVLFIIIVVSLFFGFKYIGLFNVKTVTVNGPKSIDASQVIKNSGLNEGSYYFSKSKKSRIREIEKIPNVKEAKISFSPLRNVSITVTERKPEAQIEFDGKYYIIDNEFKVIKESGELINNIPVIKGLKFKNIKTGEYILTHNSSFRDTLVKLFNSENIYKELYEINIYSKSFTLLTKDEIKVSMGSYDNIDYKIKMLGEILKDINETGKNVSEIEMEKGANPIVIINGEKEKEINKN